MKYYDELSRLETSLIKLDTFAALMDVCINGIEHSNRDNLTNAMHALNDMLISINADVRKRFDEVWEADRENSLDEFLTAKKERETIPATKSLDEIYTEIERFDFNNGISR